MPPKAIRHRMTDEQETWLLKKLPVFMANEQLPKLQRNKKFMQLTRSAFIAKFGVGDPPDDQIEKHGGDLDAAIRAQPAWTKSVRSHRIFVLQSSLLTVFL